MSIGLGYTLDGARRGMERRRAIDIEDENRAMAKEDRQRKIDYEAEDRSIDVPLRKSNADIAIKKNNASEQLIEGDTANKLKQQGIDAGNLDYQAETQGDKQNLDREQTALATEKVKGDRAALPDEQKLRDINNKTNTKKAQHDLDTVDTRLLRQDEIESMQHDVKTWEYDIAKILQQPKTAEAEAKVAETHHKIYGNIYNIAKSDPARAAQMVNDVKSNGIDNAASIVFEGGKMRIVDADGNTLSDPKYGQAEFDIEKMESAFGAKAEKGTFKAEKGLMYDTRNGKYEVIKDENGNPIKDGDSAKLERYVQNDIWSRAATSFGSQLGDDFNFSGEGANYAADAANRAFDYYKQSGDGNLTEAWRKANTEVQLVKMRDDFKGKLSRGTVDPVAVASEASKFFVNTDLNPSEISAFLDKTGVTKQVDRVDVMREMGLNIRPHNGQLVAEYKGKAVVIK